MEGFKTFSWHFYAYHMFFFNVVLLHLLQRASMLMLAFIFLLLSVVM